MINIKNKFKLSIILSIILSLTACSFKPNIQKSIESNEETTQVQGVVSIPTVEETVEILCSEEFQGRFVGTEGNDKTGEYIKEVFKNLELDTLFEEGYYHKYYQNLYGNIYRKYEDFEEEMKNKKLTSLNNVVGLIKGKDRQRAVVISAHFDHIGQREEKLYRGALDNASGTAALLEIAKILKESSKEKTFDMDIIIVAFNGEEEGLVGSRVFVKDLQLLYYEMYNINIDCIGVKGEGKLALKNKSKISGKLYEAMKITLKKNNIEFVDSEIKGTSDHASFEREGIPNIFIVEENIHEVVHRITDTPETLDYEKIKKIAHAICDFVQINDGIMFK